jgi:hypothetical protein
MNIELLYFEDCPNHELAERLVRDVLDELTLDVSIRRIAVPDETAGIAVRFPGSPTIRVDGVDVEPGFVDCDDCTPRCRIYSVDGRLTGLPAREWLVAALQQPSVAAPCQGELHST